MNTQFFAEKIEAQQIDMTEVTNTDVFEDEQEDDNNNLENEVEEGSITIEKNEKSKNKNRAEHFIKQRKNKKEEKNAYEEGRLKGLMEAYDNKNPFTGEEIKDKADQDEFLTMLEMKAKGFDPVQDFAKYLKDKQRNGSQSTFDNESENNVKKIDIAEDYINFQKENPDVDVEALTKDETFNNIYEDFSDTVPLQKIYNLYKKVKMTIDNQVNEKVTNAKARMISSAGNLNENNGTTPPLSYSKMSSKEFKEYKEKVKSGLINI